MLTEADLFEALRVCYDPELRINIVDLGRVASIHLAPDADAPGIEPRSRVTVFLLTRGNNEADQQDPMLAAAIVNRLYGLRELSHAEVQIVDTPAWTPDRMTSVARTELSKQRGLVQLG